jgi:hypothetical protein
LKLDTIEIVKSVCLVCPLWWNIFKDPFMWRSIHMSNLVCSSNMFSNDSEMSKICRYAIERSQDNLLDIDIKYFATDDLLQCIAQK